MGKRLRRNKPICSCVSPRSSLTSPLPPFSCYEEDVWTEIAKYLDGKSLVKLAATCKWFYSLTLEDSVPDPGNVAFKWCKLYASAVDGSHSYLFRQKDKHIDWLRIGAFSFNSTLALLTDKLTFPKTISADETLEKTLKNNDSLVLSNLKDGIWIADLQLVRCPVCDLNTCDGTMQVLDARHVELFQHNGFKDGSWQYTLLGTHETRKHVSGACGAIVDLKYLKDNSTAELLSTSWLGKPTDWQPKTKLNLHSVAVNTNLQDNEGIQVKYHVMRTGDEGKAVAIRITQQLL
ncbi:hypothetical protein V2J09_001581 [Rumex salicifolius]